MKSVPEEEAGWYTWPCSRQMGVWLRSAALHYGPMCLGERFQISI